MNHACAKANEMLGFVKHFGASISTNQNIPCLVGRICGVRVYFQPNSVASAKIRLSRISAEGSTRNEDWIFKVVQSLAVFLGYFRWPCWWYTMLTFRI